MDLRYYWTVLTRGRRLLTYVVLASTILSLLVSILLRGGYRVETEVLVSPLTDPKVAADQLHYSTAYYDEVTSEYILDDFAEVLRQRTFANEVEARMNGTVKAEDLKKAIVINRLHRIMKVEISFGSEAKAKAVGRVVAQMIEEQAPTYFTSSDSKVVAVKVIEPPTTVLKPSITRLLGFWLLRSLVGVVAGIAVVFVVRYFDPRLHDEWDVQRDLGLPILASISHPVFDELATHPVGSSAEPDPVFRPVPEGTSRVQAAEREPAPVAPLGH